MSELFALVVEDDFDLSTIFAAALQAAGFKTEVIGDGAVAVQRLASISPDVVVLDLHLPNVSGADILEHIRQDERLADTRVIVSTADPRMANVLEDVADLVLIKPISFSQLRDLAKRFASTF